MSRYLTPSKIALIALINLYTDSVVPTASTIPILSLLVSHLIVFRDSECGDSLSKVQSTSMISIEELQKALVSQPSAIPGRTMWDLILASLWKLNSFDMLHVFFEKLPSLLNKAPKDPSSNTERESAAPEDRIVLSRTSLLGVFVSHAHLEFERLQFHDSVTLWKDLIAYREPTLGMWRKRNSSAGKMSFDSNLQSWGQGCGHGLTEVVYGSLAEKGGLGGTVSTDDVERLLEFQVEEMQSACYACRANMVDATDVHRIRYSDPGRGQKTISRYGRQQGDRPEPFTLYQVGILVQEHQLDKPVADASRKISGLLASR